MFAKNLSFRGACVGLVGFVYLGFFLGLRFCVCCVLCSTHDCFVVIKVQTDVKMK